MVTLLNRARPIIRLSALLLIYSCFVSMALAATFTQEELAFMPATVQMELYKQGLLSPVDVVQAQIKQFKKTNKIVNAATFTHFDDALKQAKEAEQRYKNGTYRSLEGITVGIKDEHHDKGWVVTQGSLVHKNDAPMKYADPLVKKLKEAGAILIMQTTVPELYLNFVTATKAWGVTRNPWNPKYAVGGSSGGSGAALAAGYVTLATGSDMGGSIRIPSAFNGLYGYKPIFGEVHTDLPLSHFSGSGPMARTFQDMVLMHNVIAGPGDYSPNVVSVDDLPLHFESIKKMKIAYVGGMGIIEPSRDTQKAIELAIKGLEAQGGIVERVNLDLEMTPDDVSNAFLNIALSGAMGGLFSDYEGKVDKMTSYAAHFVKKASKGEYGNKELFAAELQIKKMYKIIIDSVFAKGYEVMIVPTLPTSHIPADLDFTKDRVVDDGVEYPYLVGGLYTVPFNILNWMPVITVPAGVTSQDMPVGMQIIGTLANPDAVFEVAYNYSKAGPKFYQGKLLPMTR